MIVFAKSIDDFKNYFNSVLLVEHYPQAFFINLFIDEKMKNEIIPVNSIMMTDKPKFEITIDYDNADAQLSAFLNDINACDLLFTKDKDVTSGLKIRIKNNERNEEMKTMNFNDAFKREKFDVSKTDAEGLGKKLTQFIKNRKAKYYVQRGFNMGDIADAYVAGCNNMWDLMMSKIADSVKAYKSDIGNETLTVNQAAEIFKYLLDNMKPDFEVVKENTPIDDKLHKELETLVDVAQKLIEDLKPYALEDVASEIVRVCYERFLNIKVCKNLVERIVIDSLNCKAKNLIKDLKPEYAAKEIVKMCYETLSDKDGAE